MSNEAISFGCCENFTDDGTFLGWEPKTLTKTLIGHIIAEEVAEAGMEVAGLDSFFTPSQTPTHLSAKLEINVGVSYLSASATSDVAMPCGARSRWLRSGNRKR